ncbi:hypothetical protein HELRODRAFT_72364 [Helobdella robusta]|uniref:Alpha-1,3-mannosyl-glycoprotein 4-beta-N-acetylglucosaminyltransferase B n=1 Tax=Helobdella robusta TaxID=6412 RepID=T1G0Y9_HELRO|nr:hypothetical protein HELRODRAFT_72364 [Helobdella robusta]ESO10802.1 hypothetical protein HELRODRAFT_72364 [Helobdella robusta]
MSLPNIYTYLPHLQGMPHAIQPWFKKSKNRYRVTLVMGIPTIKRDKQSYLINTLRSLLDNLNDKEKMDAIVVVSICEVYQNFINQTIRDIEANFKQDMDKGLLEIIVPSPYYYPNLDDLEDKFGDTMERVKWRTKQNLDYSYLMMYARSRGFYYLQLEDDIISKQGYFESIKSYANTHLSEKWLLLEFSHLGFIGKLFRSSDVPLVTEFFLMFHRDKPVDWLLDHLLYVKVCNPEKSNKHCFQSMESLRRRYKPSLFQHVGTYSSLKGKLQKLKDKDFKKDMLFKVHTNPSAEITTSIRSYKTYLINMAYAGSTFFWGQSPEKDDFVLFLFDEPICVGKYLFRSGDVEHPGDKFYNTSVEVLQATETSNKTTTDHPKQQRRTNSPMPKTDDDDYVEVGKFDNVSGLAQGSVPANLCPIKAVRLKVNSPSETWVILSEVREDFQSES